MDNSTSYVWSTSLIVFNCFLNIYIAIAIVLYVFVFYPILRYRKRYKNVFYYFIGAIGISDFYGLIIDHIYGDICGFTLKCPGPHWLNRIFTVLGTIAFTFSYQMQVVIALNRLSAVFAKQKHHIIFSKRNSFILMIIVAILTFVYNFPIFIEDFANIPEIDAQWFVKEPSYVNILRKVWNMLIFGHVAVLVLIYTIAYAKLRQLIVLQAATVKQRLLLYQGMLIAMPLVIQQIGYVTITNFKTTWGVLLLAIGYFWYVGCSPFVYLMLNKKLRGDVLKMMPKKVQNWFGETQTSQIPNQSINVIQIQPIQKISINN